MNQKVLQTLEFDKIINILTGYATTELGKLMCANLKPMTEEADILNAQDQTQDALTRIYKRGNVSFFGVSDLSPSLARLKMRGTLGTGELLDIARVLESVKMPFLTESARKTILKQILSTSFLKALFL